MPPAGRLEHPGAAPGSRPGAVARGAHRALHDRGRGAHGRRPSRFRRCGGHREGQRRWSPAEARRECWPGTTSGSIAAALPTRFARPASRWSHAGCHARASSAGSGLTELDDVRVGLTGAVAGLADTGSLVLVSGPGRGRIASLLPPLHIAMLRVSQLHPTYAAFLAAHPQIEDAGSNLVLITGPSRTADIEMTLTRGVHGPGEVHVVLIDVTMRTSGAPVRLYVIGIALLVSRSPAARASRRCRSLGRRRPPRTAPPHRRRPSFQRCLPIPITWAQCRWRSKRCAGSSTFTTKGLGECTYHR